MECANLFALCPGGTKFPGLVSLQWICMQIHSMIESQHQVHKSETAKIPKWIPTDLVPLAQQYAKQTRRNKIYSAILFLAFIWLVVQFCFDCFLPGHYLLARQILFLPLVTVDALCIRRFIQVGVKAGVLPILFLYLSLTTFHELRTEGWNKAFANLVVAPIFICGLWYWSMSQHKKPPVE